MMNPLPEVFIEFLENIEISSDSTAPRLIEVFGKTNLKFADGHGAERPAVFLTKRKETELSLAGCRKKLQQVMLRESHIASNDIADAVLAIAIGAGKDGAGRYAFLNDVLKRFRSASVSHFFILPLDAIAVANSMEGYSFGQLNWDVFSSRCGRAMSDYAQLYREELKERLTLQSPEFNHIVIDYLKPALDMGLLSDKRWMQLLLNYFERLSRAHFDYMWSDLARIQVLAAPFGCEFLGEESFKVLAAPFATKVTIYLEFSKAKAGYVVPEQGAITVNQGGADSEAYERFREHSKTYKLSEIGNSELADLALVCATFCSQAIRFLESGRVNDAALYATISLERLFSEKVSTTEAVCMRTAAATFLRTTGSFETAEKELRNLYEARSAFVHAGKSVTAEQASRLIEYSRETIRSLLMLHLRVENRGLGFQERWIRELDFIAVGIKAGKSFDAVFLAEQGVFSK